MRYPLITWASIPSRRPPPPAPPRSQTEKPGVQNPIQCPHEPLVSGSRSPKPATRFRTNDGRCTQIDEI